MEKLKNFIGHKPSYLKALFLFAMTLGNYKRKSHFVLSDQSHKYFSHNYNLTFLNERSVELPIFFDFLKKKRNEHNILEIGNVINHYQPFPHTVIDKYEVDDADVLNIDILDYESNEKFDAIISISTFEHIGQDENTDPQRAVMAFEKIRDLLKPNGEILVSFPIGYNQALDNYVFSQKHYFSDVKFLQRINAKNEWIECDHKQASRIRFSSPYPLGNAIALCMFKSTI